MNTILRKLDKKLHLFQLYQSRHKNLPLTHIQALGYATQEDYAYDIRINDRYYHREINKADRLVLDLLQLIKNNVR